MTDSASDHDDVRLQQVDDIAEPDRQNIGGFAENLRGQRIAFLPGLCQRLAADLFAIAARQLKDALTALAFARQPVLGAVGNRPTRGEGLDTSRLAAVALRPAKVDACCVRLLPPRRCGQGKVACCR